MKQKIIKYIWIVFVSSILFSFGFTGYYLYDSLPREMIVSTNEDGKIYFRIPFSGTLEADNSEVFLSGEKSLKNKNEIKIDLGHPAEIKVNKKGNYTLSYRLFGMITMPKIQVRAVEPEELLPCGVPAGIYLKTNGILIIGFSIPDEKSEGENQEEIYGDNHSISEVLHSGDYITKANGKMLSSKEELLELVRNSNGNPITFTVRRGQKEFESVLTPIKGNDGIYRLGIWVRNDCQGIGTITYLRKDHSFGALGHPISDTDLNIQVESHEGKLQKADIHSIIKGISGKPGSLAGTICYDKDKFWGDIHKNSSEGIFGMLNEDALNSISDEFLKSNLSDEYLKIGYAQEVHEGKASIRCMVSGKLKDYEINICDLSLSLENTNKNMVIEVTDPELKELTGGIIQGMSGSPIMQDGKLVGAVTHVFVNDPTKGYGIFIEQMLKTQKNQ